MKGSQINILTQNDEVHAFTKKLILWKRSVERNISDVFITFERCYSAMKQKLTQNFSSTTRLLCKKKKKISLYFKEVDVSKFEWVRYPFAPNNISEVTTCEYGQLIMQIKS
jgi:hypothetical protein